MNKLIIALLSGCIFFAFPMLVFADTEIAASPSLEVLGMRLGTKLTLPECHVIKRGKYKSYESRYGSAKKMKSKIPCWQHDTVKQYVIHPGDPISPEGESLILRANSDSIPHGIKFDRVVLVVVNGIVEAVGLPTKGIKVQQEILELLTDKYGLPTLFKTNARTNAMGATFDTMSATWEFSDLKVIFLGAAGKINFGHVSIRTPVGTVWEENRRETKKADGPKL
jgi:hypothetical protein